MRRTLVAVVAAAVMLGACFSSHRAKTLPSAAVGARSVYVAIGASETVGVGADNPARDAWPQVLLRTALPRATIFYDLGVSGATITDALTNQLPEAIALHPTIATVWLNVNDIGARETAVAYEQSLRTLVHGLRAGGTTAVYVADTPPVDALPAAAATLGAAVATVVSLVDAYNAAIGRVCDEEGATRVHLHDLGEAALANKTFPSLIGTDGFHPSTEGHAAVAAAFAAAIKAGKP